MASESGYPNGYLASRTQANVEKLGFAALAALTLSPSIYGSGSSLTAVFS